MEEKYATLSSPILREISNSGRAPAFADGGPLEIPPDAPRTLTEALIETASRYPDERLRFVLAHDKTAVQTYSGLVQEAHAVLAGLQRAGLKPKDRVILQVDNLQHHFAAFWGCVLGGIIPVTVAVASSYRERNGVVNKLFNTWKLLENPAVLTSAHLKPAIAGLESMLAMNALRVLSYEECRECADAPEPFAAQPEDVVFYQLTSGSTGTPKCIQETHRGIIAHVHASAQFNEYSPSDVTINWLPVDHVVPILTFHLKDTYLGCSQIHVKTDLILSNPLLWLDLMEANRVTHTWGPNFAFKLAADSLKRAPGRRWDLSSIRFFMNAGEQVTEPVIRDFLSLTAPFGVRPSAMQPAFGMAEACTCMTYHNHFNFESGVRRFKKASLSRKLQAAEPGDPETISFVDLGPPVAGVQIRITDSHNTLVEEGVIGRFQIKGDVITPGYLNNPQANEESFVGDGWFNSGDLGFILDGRLTLTGREKEMIIIRGANFYCYEIEDVVNGVEGVEPTFSAAAAVEDPAHGTEGLAIFFVPTAADIEQQSTTVRKIKSRVSSHLGIHPAHVIPLPKEQFPKTTSGKIQRTQLKKRFEAGEFNEALAQMQRQTPSDLTPPADEWEEKLLHIWQDVLGTSVGLEDAFFEHGDSLRAAQIISRIRESFHIELPLASIFGDAATIKAMARFIREASQSEAFAPLPSIQRGRADGMRPASFSQQRIWLLEQMQQGFPLYHVPVAVWLHGPLNRAALQKSINHVAARHEVLRTAFTFDDGTLWQQIRPQVDIPLPIIHPQRGAGDDEQNEAWHLAKEEAARPFDLELGPPMRAALVELNAEEHLLVVTFHQVVIDIWSLGIFLKEMANAYNEIVRGKSPDVAGLNVQFADFAQWQRQLVEARRFDHQIDYWRKHLSEPPPPTAWRHAKERPATAIFSGGTEYSMTSRPLLRELKGLSRSENATLFMTLAAAFKVLLAWESGSQSVAIGTAVGGRPRLEIEPLIGFFVNTVSLRTKLEDGISFRDLISRVRAVTTEAYANQDIPFDRVLEQLSQKRPKDRRLPFAAWFALNDPLPQIEMEGLSVKPLRLPLPVAQFDLTMYTMETGPGLSTELEYNTSLFDSAQARFLLNQYHCILEIAAARPDAPLSEFMNALAANEPGTKLPASGREEQMRSTLRAARRRTVIQ